MANTTGFLNSTLGCLFFKIKHKEEVALIFFFFFNFLIQRKIFVLVVVSVYDSQRGWQIGGL